jgi:hypothetical protein
VKSVGTSDHRASNQIGNKPPELLGAKKNPTRLRVGPGPVLFLSLYKPYTTAMAINGVERGRLRGRDQAGLLPLAHPRVDILGELDGVKHSPVGLGKDLSRVPCNIELLQTGPCR